VLPDIATCPDCLAEIFDPTNRRYLYPFTNCTNCGPRFSIIRDLPYDRPATTMAAFDMCDQCRAEYTDPRNRRFHAQPNACPDCGPHFDFLGADGKLIASRHESILKTAEAIKDGFIVAVKGIGGFHLMADAGNEKAIKRLRKKKHRPHKPLAMMFPSLQDIEAVCHADALEKRLLASPEGPIVLLRARSNRPDNEPNKKFNIAASVSPGNPYFGIMLPYTPLHHLLVSELGIPLAATSGNISEEPICIDEHEALERLNHICDFFLVHNRPIERHVDDSIVCVRMGRQQILRRARGIAPLPIDIDIGMKDTDDPASHCIAVGAHLKNSIALSVKNNVFVSQHIGDLETPKALDAFKKVIADFQDLYDAPATSIAADMHPGYLSSQFARGTKIPVVEVQHHYAHILSCMAENHLHPPLLGIAFDGTGFGPDGTIWGGEFLHITADGFERAAHWRTFPLPGGEKAIQEPRRSAIGLLYEIFGDNLFSDFSLKPVGAFSEQDLQILPIILRKKVNTHTTSSIGRLFDAVAAILNLQQFSQFEGQAAMALEFLAEEITTDAIYPLDLIMDSDASGKPAIVDWEPMIKNILKNISEQKPIAEISATFHNTLAEAAVRIAGHVGQKKVVLSGGCFQNKYLTEQTVKRFTEEGFAVYWHQRVPPNDGGISLGQIVGAGVQLFLKKDRILPATTTGS
jgi:hydrogenase maturation protein HypF